MPDAGTTMALSNKRCYLLELPRELRDLIYGYIHKKCTITEDPEKYEDPCARVCMVNGPEPQVLRVCKQVYQEYGEIAYEGSQLLFDVETVPLRIANLYTKSGFARHAMRQADRCAVRISYPDLLKSTSKERLLEWSRETRNETEAQTLQRSWTPSTEATDILADMLDHLSTVLNETCKVMVMIACDYTSDHIEVFTRSKILQAPTYRALVGDSRVPFVQNSELTLVFRLVTYLYERVVPADEAYNEDGELADSSYTARTRNDSVNYVTTKSKEFVVWDMFPCGEPESHLPTFCGFYFMSGAVVDEQ